MQRTLLNGIGLLLMISTPVLSALFNSGDDDEDMEGDMGMSLDPTRNLLQSWGYNGGCTGCSSCSSTSCSGCTWTNWQGSCNGEGGVITLVYPLGYTSNPYCFLGILQAIIGAHAGTAGWAKPILPVHVPIHPSTPVSIYIYLNASMQASSCRYIHAHISIKPMHMCCSGHCSSTFSLLLSLLE